MNRLPARYQLPLIAGVSLVVVLLVVSAVLLASRIGPTPTPSIQPTSPSPSASPDISTPEGATRAFFEAVIGARRTDDPSLLEPFVTSTSSSAYRTVAGFLAGQKESNKASITTRLDLENVSVQETGDGALLTATLLEAGYDIDLDNGQPLESPMTLDPRKLTVELRRADGVWKVDSFETGASP